MNKNNNSITAGLNEKKGTLLGKRNLKGSLGRTEPRSTLGG